MIVASLVALSLLLAIQTPAPGNPKLELDRLCGKLVHVEKGKAGKKNVNEVENTTPLGHIELALYPWKPNEPCCQAMAPVASAKTGISGYFRFKNNLAGSYWLVAYWGGEDYKTPVAVRIAKRGSDSCPLTTFRISDSGEFTYAITVIVE